MSAPVTAQPGDAEWVAQTARQLDPKAHYMRLWRASEAHQWEYSCSQGCGAVCAEARAEERRAIDRSLAREDAFWRSHDRDIATD